MNPSDGLTLVGFVITLGAAIVGWAWLRRADRRTAAANELAAQANAHAERAIALAQSAEDRADRLEHLEAEKRDVRWDWAWNKATAIITVTNIGTTPAHDVEVTVDTIEPTTIPRQARAAASVEPTEDLSLELEYVRSLPPKRLQGRALVIYRAHLRVQVVWRSPAGLHDQQLWPSLRVP
jgi:hypothetical protein